MILYENWKKCENEKNNIMVINDKGKLLTRHNNAQVLQDSTVSCV